MDGNGRWAKNKLLPRFSGHQQGLKAVRKVVKECITLKIEVLTLFAFSSENKNRPKEEIKLLTKLFESALKKEITKLNENNVHLNIIGDISFFGNKLQKLIKDAEGKLKKNNGLTLNIAANYGGRWDIVETCKKISTKIEKGDIKINDINEELFSKNTSLSGYPEVDLLIRTSNEFRISNFMLWDIAYSELYFTPVLWPDFDAEELNKAIVEYQNRDRRFGKR